MRICLISPPTVTELSEHQLADDEIQQIVAEYAPMGLLSLAAVLEAQGVVPHIVDLNHLYYEFVKSVETGESEPDFVAVVVRELEAFQFDAFGLSTICSTYPLTLRIAREIRRTRPDVKIILGGPQASVVDVLTLKAFPYVDFILRGEAEVTLPQLLDALSSGRDKLDHVGGLTYHSGGEVVRNTNAPVIDNLDELPMPAFHLYPHIRGARTFPLEAGRGCPFACSFCSTNDFFRRRYRLKSPQLLLNQMRLINKTYGADCFELIHDMFTVDRKKVVAFCETLLDSSQGFTWTCSARTDCLDDELLELMAEAGCVGVFLGVDSGSERIQSILNKDLDLDQATSRVKAATMRGLSTTVSLITGFPEEQEDDLRATVRFFGESLRHQNAKVQFHLLAPLAETPITTKYKEELIYDEIFSDISFQGWEQHPEDRALISAHRDIFTNFYAVPTRWLDRTYLMELREFLLRGVSRHRWLMTYLHQDSGDLSRVFEQWKRWLLPQHNGSIPGSLPAYYASPGFSEELISFVGSYYAKAIANHPHLASTLAKVGTAVASLSEKPLVPCQKNGRRRRTQNGSISADAVPTFAAGTRRLQVNSDYNRLIKCLKRKGRLGLIPAEHVQLALIESGGTVKVLQLNDLTAQLLSLCDGSRSVVEVAQSFAAEGTLDDIPIVQAGFYGLLKLKRQGLIDFTAATN